MLVSFPKRGDDAVAGFGLICGCAGAAIRPDSIGLALDGPGGAFDVKGFVSGLILVGIGVVLSGTDAG